MNLDAVIPAMIGTEYLSAIAGWGKTDGHKYFTYERNRGCNLRCRPCKVWSLYDPETELTVEQSLAVYDRLHEFGYNFGTALGGEPLHPYLRNRGVIFYDQSRMEVRHAKSLGMIIGISTNGTFFGEKEADEFKKDGLDWITFSPHKDTPTELKYLVDCAQIAASRGIIPVIHFLATKYNIADLPERVAYVVKSGAFPAVTIVQEKEGDFSHKPADPEASLIPDKEQEQILFDVLSDFKLWGWAKNNRSLLKNAPKYYPNIWKCDPFQDTFLHIGARGTMDVCEEVRTTLSIFQVKDLSDLNWRKAKKDLVDKCTGCLYRCYYESENPYIIGDLPTVAIMAFIKAARIKPLGKLTLPAVKAWGQVVARMVDTERALVA